MTGLSVISKPLISIAPKLSRREKLNRVFGLMVALVPLVGSVILNRGMHLSFLGCPLVRFAGIPCPAWGLTRSFMAIARGDLLQAMAFHLFGPLFFLGFGVAATHLSLEILSGRRIHSLYVQILGNPKTQILIFLVILAYHGTRLHALFKTGELQHAILHSPLYQLLF